MSMGRRHIESQRTSRQRGFTLTELMIVIAIVGILAAVGYPSYRGTVIKTNRSVATSALTELASRQESYYLDRKRYATALSSLGYPNNIAYYSADGQLQPGNSADGNTVYSISFSGTPTARAYTAVATPFNGQTDDEECTTLTITQNGKKSGTGTDVSKCW